MWFRRAFYYAQFGAFVALPVCLLIGRGLVVESNGWSFAVLLLVSPMLAVFMLVVAGFTVARKSVRSVRAVSWLDVGVLFLWYLSIVTASVFAHPAIAVLVVLLSVVAFWSALWQLFTETRNRMKAALAGLDYTVTSAAEYRSSRLPTPDARGAGTIIRIDPPRD